MVKLRKFSLSDLKEVMEIKKVSFPNRKDLSKKYFKKLYQKYPKGFLVAEIEGKVAGYIIGQKRKEKARVISLAITSNRRQKRVGTKLTDFLISHFKKEGVREVFLRVRTKNKIGIMFHKKLGFKILKTIKNYYQNGDDAYLMKKEI